MNCKKLSKCNTNTYSPPLEIALAKETVPFHQITYKVTYSEDNAMMTIQRVGNAIHARREEVGLNKTQLAKLSKLSRQTIHGLESGSLNDLSFNRLSNLLSILGMNFDTPRRKHKKALWMAAKSCSVSYCTELTSDHLQQVLSTGKVLSGFEANLLHFLDELPVQLIVMSIEEVAQQTSVKPQKIWKNIAKLAKALSANRNELWT